MRKFWLPVYLLITLIGWWPFQGSQAQVTPTFNRDVAPIIYKNCAQCHRPNAIGGFSLLTYKEVHPLRDEIVHATQTREMPPWPPDPSFSKLAHPRTLTDGEIATLKDWVESGAEEGNPADLPPVPAFQDSNVLGRPELKLFAEKYTLRSNVDEYRSFVIPSGFDVDKYLSGIELIPGNLAAVHHILLFYDVTGRCKQLDAQDPGPGYASFGGVGTNDARLIGGWVPGQTPRRFPQGFAFQIPKGADFVMQIHYAPGSAGQQDRSSVNLFFETGSPTRNLALIPALNHYNTLTNGPLVIPPNVVKRFNAQITLNQDMSILSIAPHMHLLGKSIKVFGKLPNGDTLKLINIPNWEFHWQGFYVFQKITKIPAGTTLYSEAVYDNTSNNPHNPNNPPQTVRVGEATTDEMMLVYFTFLPYQDGDEEIILDSSLVTSNTLVLNPTSKSPSLYPNPLQADQTLRLKDWSPGAPIGISVLNHLGVLVEAYSVDSPSAELGELEIPFRQSRRLTPGLYFVTIRQGAQSDTQKILIE